MRHGDWINGGDDGKSCDCVCIFGCGIKPVDGWMAYGIGFHEICFIFVCFVKSTDVRHGGDDKVRNITTPWSMSTDAKKGGR